MFSPKRSRWPPFFCLFGKSRSLPFYVASLKKNLYVGTFWARTSLRWPQRISSEIGSHVTSQALYKSVSAMLLPLGCQMYAKNRPFLPWSFSIIVNYMKFCHYYSTGTHNTTMLIYMGAWASQASVPLLKVTSHLRGSLSGSSEK